MAQSGGALTCDSAFGARAGLAVLVGLATAFSRFTGGLSAECSLPLGRVVVVAVLMGKDVSQPMVRGGVAGKGGAAGAPRDFREPRNRGGGAGIPEKGRGNKQKLEV